MPLKSYYSNTGKKKRASVIMSITFGSLTALLLAFIIWCAAIFGGTPSEQFQSQAQEISELKVQIIDNEAQINSLLEELGTLRSKLQEQEAPPEAQE